jgi:hypothetical protein
VCSSDLFGSLIRSQPLYQRSWRGSGQGAPAAHHVFMT